MAGITVSVNTIFTSSGGMAMYLFYFFLGLIVGIIILQLVQKFSIAKWKMQFEDNKRILQLVESSQDLVYFFELKPELKFRYVSPSIEKMLGPNLVEESYKNPLLPFDYIHPDDHDILYEKLHGTIDYSKPILQRWKDSEGNYKWCEEFATPIYENGEKVALVGIIRDISEKVKLQQDLEYLSTHDTLTGIYNRNFFEIFMERYDKQIDTSIAIILCDVDELKYINDNFGHVKGDVILTESAKLLSQLFFKKAIVARVGGDEFAIILKEVDKSLIESHCEMLSKKIIEYSSTNNDLQIEMSIGFAFSEHSIGKMESLYAEADKNMYLNKRARKEFEFA
jgi:diguanylate cyclase (GGDEF)-like protein/PAS domain S-box-containing protein